MNKISKSSNILIAFFSNPEHITPVYDAICFLSEKYNVTVVQRNAIPLNYSYPTNVTIYKVGSGLKHNENTTLVKTIVEYFQFIFKIRILLKQNKCLFLLLYDMNAFVAGNLATFFLRKPPIFYHQNETVLSYEIPPTRFFYFIKRLEMFFAKSCALLSFVEPNRAKLFLKDAGFERDYIIVDNCPKRIEKIPMPYKELEKYKTKGCKIILHRGPIGDGSSLDIHETLRSIKHWPLNSIFVIQGYRTQAEENKCIKITKEESIQDRVVFLPFISSYLELLEVVAAADVGLVLYKPNDVNRTHATPVKLYDYLACGVPAIVPKSMLYISDLIDSLKVGFSYENSKSESIGEVISKLLEHPDRNKMIENARKTHLDKLNYEYQFSLLFNAISKIVKNNHI